MVITNVIKLIFAIWFELGVLTFVYVLTAFKIARLGYEVTAQKIVAPWVAATDIATLQKSNN